MNEIEKQWQNYINNSSASMPYQKKSSKDDKNPNQSTDIDTKTNLDLLDDYDESSNRIIPFYNVQVFSDQTLIIAPEVEELSEVSQTTYCDEKVQTDFNVVSSCDCVKDKPKKRKVRKAESVDTTIKNKKLKRSSVNSLIKRVTAPTHASAIKAAQVNGEFFFLLLQSN